MKIKLYEKSIRYLPEQHEREFFWTMLLLTFSSVLTDYLFQHNTKK
jgi:hypothetical protein